GSRIYRQILHADKRFFDGPGQSGTSNVSGLINLVGGGPNRWRPEWFEEESQFHAGLSVVPIAFRSVRLNQTNRALMTGSDPLRKLEFALVIRGHGKPATGCGAKPEIHVPLNHIRDARGPRLGYPPLT